MLQRSLPAAQIAQQLRLHCDVTTQPLHQRDVIDARRRRHGFGGGGGSGCQGDGGEFRESPVVADGQGRSTEHRPIRNEQVLLRKSKISFMNYFGA